MGIDCKEVDCGEPGWEAVEQADQEKFLDDILAKSPELEFYRKNPEDVRKAVRNLCLEGIREGVEDFKSSYFASGVKRKSIYSYSQGMLSDLEFDVQEILELKLFFDSPDDFEGDVTLLSNVVADNYESFVVGKASKQS